jgi:glutamate-5-semialdehyde dehydrogenase
MRRTGICGSAETLLLDRALDRQTAAAILADLIEAGCEIRGDTEVCALASEARPATEQDWRTEYLDAIISARFVDGIDGAIDHIAAYSSNHTEAVIAEDADVVERFFNRRSIRRSCCTMPRPSSPMAANSAWERRSASPPARCMPAARSASSN